MWREQRKPALAARRSTLLRRESRRLSASAVLFAASLGSADLRAQTRGLDDYALAPLQDGTMLSLWGSEPLEPGSYALGLGMHARPALAEPEAERSGAEDPGSLSTLEVLGSVGVWHGADISGGITAHTGDLNEAEAAPAAADESRAAVGDVRLIPRVRLIGGGSPAKLALALPIWIPAGSGSVFAQHGMRFEPRALASYFGERATLSANAGYLLSRPEDRSSQAATRALTGGIGADVPILDTWSVLMEVSGRWYLNTENADSSARTPVEARAGVRFSIASWMAQLGGGMGVTGAASEADWRLIAAVGFRPPASSRQQRSVAAAVPSDRDGDGVPDASDSCPDEAEPRRDVSDLPGCPPESNSVAALVDDAASDTAGEATAVKEPSPAPEVSAPKPAPPAKLPEIREIVYFEPNLMRLDPAQLAVIDAVASQMKAAPPDAQLMIEGHSDATGPTEFNWKLSQRRAATIRLYLIQRGLSWRRLSTLGRGASRPLEPNANEQGRARNRRVEFRLVRAK